MADRPVVSDTAEEVYEGLGPYVGPDADHDYHLLKFVASTADLIQPVADLARDTPNQPGWAVLFDPNTAPVESLDWLGQFLGVEPAFGLTEAARRARIRETAGFRRGSVAALEGAARQHLTGARQVKIFERDGGNPYRIRVRTYLGETPDPLAVRRALLEQKPAGIVLTYDVASGSSYAELSTSFATYTILNNAFGTYRDQTLWIPGAATVAGGTFKVRL
jgi:hypothetical protein